MKVTDRIKSLEDKITKFSGTVKPTFNKQQHEDVKFSIITPSILRNSVVRTCQSINNQSYKNWEHILMIDIPQNKLSVTQGEILNSLNHDNRKIVFCKKSHNNFGNTCRYNAYRYVTGDLIGYLDDDDYFDEQAFELISEQLKKIDKIPDAIVYPANRFGQKFFNIPPGCCMTVTGQYMHKPEIQINSFLTKEVRWVKPPDNDKGYFHDGYFIESLKEFTEFTPLEIDKNLVHIERSNHGNPDPKIGILISFYQNYDYRERAMETAKSQNIDNVSIQIYDRDDTDTKLGIAKSYNILMRKAFQDGCTHVFIMAGDDWLDENALSKGYEIAKKGYSYIPFSYKYSTGGQVVLRDKVSLDEEVSQNAYSAFVLMNKAAWEETGGYREDLPGYVSEDWDMHMRATKLNFDICTLKDPVYNYRLHDNQGSRFLPLNHDLTHEFFRKEYFND
jgi:hypothetical protein